MFPTTVWTTIGQAGAHEPRALEDFARRYRAPVLAYARSRGLPAGDAEDVCQEVFLRVLQGGVLARADRSRGRFRSLLLTITTRVIVDRWRRRGDLASEDLDPPQREQQFDRTWALHLAERAMAELREQGSPYYEVLAGHLSGQPQNRNRLWLARRKLASLIRKEIAYTCASRLEFEEELAYLSRFLRPAGPGGEDEKE